MLYGFSGVILQGALVTLELALSSVVVHASTNQLLWVQVRSDSRATANRVLDSVTLHGM